MVTRALKRGERRVNANITLHPDVDSAVEDAAWQMRKTKSRLINDILVQWLQAREDSKTASSVVRSH